MCDCIADRLLCISQRTITRAFSMYAVVVLNLCRYSSSRPQECMQPVAHINANQDDLSTCQGVRQSLLCVS
jgi:hypothetical protein